MAESMRPDDARLDERSEMRAPSGRGPDDPRFVRPTDTGDLPRDPEITDDVREGMRRPGTPAPIPPGEGAPGAPNPPESISPYADTTRPTPETTGAANSAGATVDADDEEITPPEVERAGPAQGRADDRAGTRRREEAYWREAFRTRPYVNPDADYDAYQTAYEFGWEARARYPDAAWEQVENDLRREWDDVRAPMNLPWSQARQAVRDAWDRLTPR